MSKNEPLRVKDFVRTQMDPPKTRSESKKNPKTKAQGKTIYSAKHVRQLEALKEKKTK